MLQRLVRSAHAWVMLCTWQPLCRLLSSDLTGGKLSIALRSCRCCSPRTLPTRTVLRQDRNPCFFIHLKLHHRGETATSVDYLSFLCYPMDIHCKADPFSAMHREYIELVYGQIHAGILTLNQMSSATFTLSAVQFTHKTGSWKYYNVLLLLHMHIYFYLKP